MLGLALFLSVAKASGAPFARFFTFTQPDGTQLRLWGQGDDFQAVFETTSGYTVLFEPQSRAYFYARRVADGKRLVSTGVLAHLSAPPGLDRHQRLDPAAVAEAAHVRQKQWDADLALSRRWAWLKSLTLGTPLPPGLPTLPAPPSNPTLGTKVGLTLLIDFSDAPATIPQAEIEAFCNSDSYTGFGDNGSVKKYYSDNSAGRLLYSNVVTLYVRMTLPKSFYNDTSKDCGTQGRLLINDALAILKARPDYTTTILPTFNALTADAAGNVVAFNVFYAGGDSGVWAYGLWPHSWTLAAPVPLGNGKSVFPYQVTNVGSSLELGTFCHENGHMLCGFPDIYDYDYDSVGGAGDFCLMDYGGFGVNPCQVCAYLKLAAGWTTPNDVDSTTVLTGTLTAAPNTGFDQVYRFRRPNVSTEYFLLENRQKSGRDANLPAAGIAVWHIDELGNRDNQSLVPNSSHQNYEVTLVQADNLWHFEAYKNYGDTSDLFYLGNSASGYLNRLDDASSPNAHWWDGSASGMNLNKISAAGPAMTFQLGQELSPPLLATEPPLSPGTSNTIYWQLGASLLTSPPASNPASLQATGSPAGQLCSSAPLRLAPSLALSPAPAKAGEGQAVVDGLHLYFANLTPPHGPAAKSSANSQPGNLRQTSAAQAYDWLEIGSETFENAFPGGNWVLYGSPTWGRTTNSAHSGSWSAWCAGSSLPPAGGYANNMGALMVYGPFNLADALNARVTFWFKNKSQNNCDFFGWLASTNAYNFYGYVITGDQNSWQPWTFELSTVFTLGNLCGQSQVWLAFYFTSDSSITDAGAFVDDVVIQKQVAPDLAPYQPLAWADKVPLSLSPLYGTEPHSYTGPYPEGQPLYFNWASANQSSLDATAYTVRLEVTGTGGLTSTWSNVSTPAKYYSFLTQDQRVGPLAAGEHSFKLWVDYDDALAEANENNNYYERTINVVSLAYYAECAPNTNFNPAWNSGWIQQTQYTFTNLTPGQTYWYRVKARLGTQESPWSNLASSLQGGPSFTSMTIASGTNFCLQASGFPGAAYELWLSTNLVHWLRVATNTTNPNGLWQFIDNSLPASPTRFYRLQYTPPP